MVNEPSVFELLRFDCITTLFQCCMPAGMLVRESQDELHVKALNFFSFFFLFQLFLISGKHINQSTSPDNVSTMVITGLNARFNS